MSEPFIGEIRMFGGNFAPRSWALCDGQLLAITSNEALFSLIGTIYGGDGRTTFGLPDLRSRVPIGPGQGPGLPFRQLGFPGGAERVSLNATTNALHTHAPTTRARSTGANTNVPGGNSLAVTPAYSSVGPNASLGSSSVSVDSVGSSQSHNNVQPFRVVNYIIALQGFYPSR